MGTNEGYLDIVLVLASHPIEEVEECWINDTRVYLDEDGDVLNHRDLPQDADTEEQRDTQKRYAGHAHFEFRLDGESLPFPKLKEDSKGRWDAQTPRTGDAGIKGTGLALAYFRGKWKRDIYPNGEPSLSFVVKGANQIHDPRDDSMGYTENAALCCAYALEQIPKIRRRRINKEQLMDAAATCDMPENAFGDNGEVITEPAYRASAVISSEDNTQQIIDVGVGVV